MRLDDDDIAVVIAAHSLRLALVGLHHLPAQQESAVRRKLLHARGHVHNIQIVIRIHRHAARLVQLPHPGAARADDLHRLEQFALNGMEALRRAAHSRL